jgi:hypothetical protein
MQGAHVIKSGLRSILIDLLGKGTVQTVASNGAATIMILKLRSWAIREMKMWRIPIKGRHFWNGERRVC